jgi:UDP-2-acetamido-2,6-beta-L-arabino-hexul-4-ose reductase
MKVLITGANGFLGKNLQLFLRERRDVGAVAFTRENQPAQLPDLLAGTDFVFHLAGINRPLEPGEFVAGNVELTQALCEAVVVESRRAGKAIPVLYASSTQATQENPYGQSKRQAEEILMAAARESGVPVRVFRLPNVFGKWCRPNYNSVVATFCHNVARNQPIQVHDANAAVTLAYIDDVVERFIQLMDGADGNANPEGFESVSPQYTVTVGALAQQILAFHDSRQTLLTERVGSGLVRALYATYVSYLPVEEFAYAVPEHRDARGVFVEMLKTPDCGQFSFLTAHPGVTRGGHYHQSKTEKFLVIKGRARFRFRHMYSGETHELLAFGDTPQVVETIPGWTHDITNIGQDEMIVMLWANEVFDRTRPDTYSCPL